MTAPSASGPRAVFAFFGHPGAGKSTLCRRFGELHRVPSLDTDTCMTPEEVAAVEAGHYTQAMRLANIQRYAARVRDLLAGNSAVAIADGLPNDESRALLRRSLPRCDVVFVLVKTPRALWETRLAGRGDSPVQIDIATADAYVLQNWQEPGAWLEHEVLYNGEDAAALEDALRDLYARHLP